VGKKESLTLGTTAVAKNIEKGPYDEWSKQEVDYQQRYAKANSYAGSPGYGISDLNYYGNFINMPGCGMMWQPYFVSAAWDPFQTGLWAYYPGAGYSWVSPYPWGWLPYHSGTWAYCGAGGWGWRPGGAFYGLQNTALVTQPFTPAAGAGTPLPVHTGPTGPKAPVPPRVGGQGLVMSNASPIVKSRMESDGFVFEKNSAGLGVPRGQLGSLNKISNDVGHNGAMTMPVDVRAFSHSGNGGPNGQHEHAPVMLKPAGAPEVHGNSAAYHGGGPGNPNGGGGGQPHSNAVNAGGQQQHNSGSAGGPPPAPHNAGGGGNYGGGGGHMGGGAPPPPPPPPPPPAPAAASSAGGAHK
jgi:hypothetical protein